MHPIIIIPARMAASRLPGKPLVDIGGTPMILRVLRLALESGVGPVAVAAGDPEIAWAVESAGGQAVLTDPDLPSGSDRIKAALAELDPAGRHDVVINLQGDIPFVDPAMIRACADVLANEPGCDISTLIAPEGSAAERTDPDCPKAIVTLLPERGVARAHYFTRSTLYGDAPVWRHIGIYGYRRAALEMFTAAPPSPLEKREKLEQLRALELGLSIWAAIAPSMPMEVNNEAELAIARAHAETL